MFMFFGLLGMLGFIVFPIMAIVSLFTKSGKAKRNFIIGGVSFLILAVSAFSDDSPEITTEAEQEDIHIEETNQKEIDAEKEAQEKAAKAETEKEARAKEKEQAEKEAKEKEEAKKEAKQKEEAAKDKAEKKAKEKEKKAKEKSKKKAKEKEKAAKKADLNDLTAHFIDVGQADAILLEYSEGNNNYNILIDSGDWNSNASVNYLNQQNIKQIDLLVGTHPHSDHIGQMDTIINQFDVSEVWMSGDVTTTQVFERVLNAIDDNNIDYNEPRVGEEYKIGPLDIKVVAPTSINGDLNDGSIAFKAIYGDVSFLFTGDAETASEQTMLSSGADLKADILKVGHHGSDTSSTAGFVEAVNPKVGVISVGKNNSYGHPSASVIDRMNSRGVDLYSTSDNGTVIIKTDGNKYSITTKEDGNVTPSSSGGKGKSAKSESSKEDNAEKTPPPKETPSGDCVDINSANESEVQEIIHIGPERSKDLIDLRPYNSVEELSRIKGIGPARIDDIIAQGKACVGG